MQLGTIGRYRRSGWITDTRLEPVRDMLLNTALWAISEALKQSFAAATLGLELFIQRLRRAAPADNDHRLDYGSIASGVGLARLFRQVKEPQSGMEAVYYMAVLKETTDSITAHHRKEACRDASTFKEVTGSTANRETLAEALHKEAAGGTVPGPGAHTASSPASVVTSASAAIHVCAPEAVLQSDPESRPHAVISMRDPWTVMVTTPEVCTGQAREAFVRTTQESPQTYVGCRL